MTSYRKYQACAACLVRSTEAPFPQETKKELYAIFEELDAFFYDMLPLSLLVPPAELIAHSILKKTGISITAADVFAAYRAYELMVCFGGDADE